LSANELSSFLATLIAVAASQAIPLDPPGIPKPPEIRTTTSQVIIWRLGRISQTPDASLTINTAMWRCIIRPGVSRVNSGSLR
jgi:hypothetical protein